jgi:hypothetical protein
MCSDQEYGKIEVGNYKKTCNNQTTRLYKMRQVSCYKEDL